MSSDTSSVGFGVRVAHFDIGHASDSDTENDGPNDAGASGVSVGRRKADDIEKEYLMGGGGTRPSWGAADEEDALIAAEAGCCARACGGYNKASRIEGRNLILSSAIFMMAIAGLLLYSSYNQWNAPNRRIVSIVGIALGGIAEFVGIVGLIGLYRFTDIDKIPFKIGYWFNLIQLWANAAYLSFLLFVWDGNVTSGTSAISSAAAATTVSGAGGDAAAAGVKAAAAFIELSVEASAPMTGAARASAQFQSLVNTQVWFLGLVGLLLLFSLLYAYGSLRLRCKKMGKWGTAVTGVLLAMLAMATIAFGALSLYSNPKLRTLNGYLPIVGQMAVAGLIVGTVIYEFLVSTRVQKLKQLAKDSFTKLLILTLVAFVLGGVCCYTYYLALHTTPRIDLFHLTALAGVSSEVLLLAFGVQLIAWRYALPDEYPSLPAVEKFGPADESEVFVVPPQTADFA